MNNVHNPYQGVNPHLNSFLQSPGGAWEAFHTSVIERLVEYLEQRLPPNYYALSETSLQVSTRRSEDAPPTKPRKTIPDVAVYQTQPLSSISAAGAVSAPTLTLMMKDMLEDEAYATSVVIYRYEMGELPGMPITRLEVLSPANKPGGSYFGQYMTKRREALESGLRLVEIDLLHETRPLLRTLPSYPDGHEDAYPYSILVSDPRPDMEHGQIRVYGFPVDEPLPTVPVPLADEDVVTIEFGIIYDLTFKSRRLFSMVVDYETEPVRFWTYATTDQAAIRFRMERIRQENQK
jgi:hypothetical protein